MDAYRKGLLLIKGLLYDSKNGYLKASKLFEESDLNVDLNGMVFLITGANSGIGFEAAKEIARRSGEVHLVSRNATKAEAARNTIVQETNNNKIYHHILDLSCIANVHQFVDDFLASQKQLDVIINNAGETIPEFKRSKNEGLETTFATNVVGPYTLTTGLIPLLKASKRKARVVTVGSSGMQLQRLNPNYIEKLPKKYDPIMVYAQCKRQMAVLTEHWAEEHPEINFSCMHPGWVDTPAARRGLGEFYEKMGHKFRCSEQGADTVVWLAISKAVLKHPSGAYFQDRQCVDKHLPMGRTKENMHERTNFIKYVEDTSVSLHRR